MTRLLFGWLLLIWGTSVAALECRDTQHLSSSYTVCAVDMATDDLRLFHSDGDGNLFGDFAALDDHLKGDLAFAMNAGMYHADRRPVGLYQENGTVLSDIVIGPGPGNFGMVPNGVLCLTDTTAHVVESSRYDPAECRDATQSGPMLVISGALHPRFIPDGTSRFLRNGVGTTADGRAAYFAISNEPVNFHDFATLFRDHLKVPQALYFDGRISRLYAPSLGRADRGFQMGPMVGVVEGR